MEKPPFGPDMKGYKQSNPNEHKEQAVGYVYKEKDGSSFVEDYMVPEDEEFAQFLGQPPATTHRSI